MFDIIIVGAGPAGLTAAIYARRALKKVLVLEAKTYGGQIVSTLDIENYPTWEHISGFDFSTKIYNQAKSLGAEIVFEKVIDIENLKDCKKVKTNKNEYSCKALILATGSDNRKLDVEGEDELLGKGISYCATCDGAFYKNMEVAVVGGGNTALEDAIYLSDIAKVVYLIHRRDEFRAEVETVEKVKKKKNINIIYNSRVTKLITEKDKLKSVELKNDKDETSKIDISCLFVAVGRIPENQNFSKIIDLDEKGYIKAGEDCITNVDGIFAAGDNRVKSLRQLVTAAGDGAVAATEAIKYINRIEKK